MVTISDLPRDLLGEILSRFPLTSLRSVRLTCKTWNAFSKKQILGKIATRKNQFLEFMIVDSKGYLLRFDIQGILNDKHLVDPTVKRIIKSNDNEVEFCRVFHCHGLFLCVAKDHPSVLVCNPYMGQIKWIQAPREQKTYRWLHYALGYDNINHNHKIMSYSWGEEAIKSIDVYDFSSESWKVLDVYPGEDDVLFNIGVSVKGNTYLTCEVITYEYETTDMYLLCFDFTTEQLGSPLRLPFPSLDTHPLYWVRDEKLAVSNDYDCEIIEIWITTKIEPNAISWNNFLKIDLSHINGLPNDFAIEFNPRSFFIYEDKKVVVLFDESRDETTEPCRYLNAYIFGEDGYYKNVNMGVEAQDFMKNGKVVCSSYVPSLVQLKLNQLGKRKERDE